MNPMLDDPPVKNTAFYLRRIRNWTVGLGILGIIAILYYNMSQGVYAEQDAEKIAIRQKEMENLERDRAFIRGQVDRIVNAISNRPINIIIIQRPQYQSPYYPWRHHEQRI